MNEPINIFISYSHKDEAYKDQLLTYLAPLKMQFGIEAWNDTEIQAGEEWNEKIWEAFNKSQVIVLMLSPDFFNSEFITKHELSLAMKKHENKEAIVIPIFIRPCFLKPYPNITRLEGLPKGQKYVSTQDDKDTAYLQIIEGLHRVLNDMNDLGQDEVEQQIKEIESEVFNKNATDLDEKKKIFIAATSNNLDTNRRALFLELFGMNKYDSWPYEPIPDPKQAQALEEMDADKQQDEIEKWLDGSLLSVHLIDSTKEHNLDLQNLQFVLARKKCSGSLFKCVVAFDKYDSDGELENWVEKARIQNPNIILLKEWDNSIIIDTLNGIIEENEKKKEDFRQKLVTDKSVFLLFDEEDSKNPWRGKIKSLLENEYHINVRQPISDQYNESGFNIREFEKEEMRKCDGVIMIYGNAREGWCISRQSAILEEKGISSKDSRLICVDDPNKDEKLQFVVNTTQFSVVDDPSELSNFIENL